MHRDSDRVCRPAGLPAPLLRSVLLQPGPVSEPVLVYGRAGPAGRATVNDPEDPMPVRPGISDMALISIPPLTRVCKRASRRRG